VPKVLEAAVLTPNRLCNCVAFYLLFIVVFTSLSGCSSSPAFSQTGYYPETLWLSSPDDNARDKAPEKSPKYRPTVLYFDGQQKMHDYGLPQWQYARIYGIRGTHPIAGSAWSIELGLMRVSNVYTLQDSPFAEFDPGTFGYDQLSGVVLPVYVRYEVPVSSWLRPYVKAGLAYQILYRHWDRIIADDEISIYEAEIQSLGVEGGVGVRMIYGDFVGELGVDYGYNKGNMKIKYGYFSSQGMRHFFQDMLDNSDLGPKPRVYISVGMQF